MIFHSVRHALRWYARAVNHDGCRAVWPDPSRVYIPNGARLDFLERLLTMWAVWRALELLDASQRRLLSMYHVQELPVIDIAARWHRHPSRIYRMVTRAEQMIRGRLLEEELIKPKTEERAA